MKKGIMAAFLVFLFFLLQTGVLRWAAVGGITPDLLVILTVSLGFLCGEKTGMLVGFACGLLTDLYAVYGGGMVQGDLLGFYALLYLLTGYAGGQFNGIFFPEEIKFPLLLIALSDLALNFVRYVFQFLLRARLNIGYYFLHVILPEAVYTLLVSLAVYPFLLLCVKLAERKGRGSTE